MAANMGNRENDLVDAATEWLRARVPNSWTIELRNREEGSSAARADAELVIRSPSVYATLAVEARRSLAPREVANLFGSLGRRLRTLSPNVPLLVVAPWLSARTRELLAAEDVNYIDLTGNALLRLENPALFIQTQGAARDPAPAPRGKARVRGPRAGRLIRTLVDVRPPYGVRELADAAGLAPGYVSQLLDALDDEALVDRGKRRRVESVDIAGLLRRWAESYEVFTSNDTAAFLAPRGAEQTLPLLAGQAEASSIAITGSFAAVRIAAVAAPRFLVVYSDNAKALAEALALIPADAGANVALLRPFDPIVWQRTSEQDGLRYVAPSQVAVDCLTGNGRMPAEGEAVLEWMLANEAEWRLDSLTELTAGAA
jgi:hypothetical protein